MLYRGSISKPKDNSGIKKAKKIGTVGSFSKKVSRLGEISMFSMKLTNKSKRFVKKNLNFAAIVGTRIKTFRGLGMFLRFSENGVIILNDQKTVSANRIYGPIPKELKRKSFENLKPLINKIV